MMTHPGRVVDQQSTSSCLALIALCGCVHCEVVIVDHKRALFLKKRIKRGPFLVRKEAEGPELAADPVSEERNETRRYTGRTICEETPVLPEDPYHFFFVLR